jgi:hypothetical protein
MADAALIASLVFSLMRIDLTLSAERLIFLGTASSLIIRSSTSTHCLRTFSAVIESPTHVSGKKVNDDIRLNQLRSDDIVVVFKRMWHVGMRHG